MVLFSSFAYGNTRKYALYHTEPCCVSEKSIQWCSVLYGVQCNANWSLNEVDWQIMLLIYCSAANWANRHLALVSLLSATELFLEQGEASLFSSLWEYWKMTARGFLPFFSRRSVNISQLLFVAQKNSASMFDAPLQLQGIPLQSSQLLCTFVLWFCECEHLHDNDCVLFWY